MHTDDEIDARVQRLSKEIELARKQLELAELLAHARVSDQEHIDLTSLQGMLETALTSEIDRTGSVNPADPRVHDFVRDWITENWRSRFRSMEVVGGVFPHAVMQEALHELYALNQRNFERRGAIAELNESLFWTRESVNRSWWRQWFARLWRIFKRRSGRGQIASELRTERRQRGIQRWFSSVAVAFTLATALFMTAMFVVGVLQLYNAVAQGVGLSWQVAVDEPNLPDLGVAVDEQALSDHSAVADHRSSANEAQRHGRQWLIKDANARSDPHKSMQTSLLALEIILLAPLPYLLVLGLTRYIKALAYQERADDFRRELLEFKAFEVALFIAIIAAAVVERVLRSGKGEGEGLTYEFSISVVLVMGVLAGYYFLIEHASKSEKSE